MVFPSNMVISLGLPNTFPRGAGPTGPIYLVCPMTHVGYPKQQFLRVIPLSARVSGVYCRATTLGFASHSANDGNKWTWRLCGLKACQDLPHIALNCNKWTWRLHGLKACQSCSRMVMFLTRANCHPLHNSTIPSQTLSVMQLLNIDLCTSLDCDLSSDTIIFSTSPPLLSLPNDFTACSLISSVRLGSMVMLQSSIHFPQHFIFHSGFFPTRERSHIPSRPVSPGYWPMIGSFRGLKMKMTMYCAFESVIDKVLSVFEHLPWDIELKGFGAHTSIHTSELLPLLADSMVNGHLLDALVAAINDHVDEHNGTVVVQTTLKSMMWVTLLLKMWKVA
ncbi:uncharacterized protein BJ212DRAFT_1503361 [Suillus subaureus]|uniref:Uncharacterized protein n=1 Tax=Suillus subaureus TaxID=48587 RepID=A0A9P7EBH3_9AGAM|nr:uncharacterized protein BJ212DRAFT_1503361 [Suillus subaureus]KAG1816429.1 hypothetical protein BJ212DRAFT_1503361 [Suillus subaureus]